MTRFTLQPRTWYAMEFTLPNGERQNSPIFCYGVEPKKSGKGWIDLDFWHGAYAEGVNRKIYELRVLHRDTGYLLATREFNESLAVVLLTSLTDEWMQLHFRQVLVGKPSDVSLIDWLARQYPGVVDHTPINK